MDEGPINLDVDAQQLKTTINLLDTTSSDHSLDRPELHCDAGTLIIRQGDMVRAVPCVGSFLGTYSIAVSSAAKWKSRGTNANESVRLKFENKKLCVGQLSLPVKWTSEMPDIPDEAPRFVPNDQATGNPAPVSEASGKPVKTAPNFRVNVACKAIAAVFTHFARQEIKEDLYFRTWNDVLIIETQTTEVRVDVIGKIQGFAVLPARELSRFESIELPDGKYTTWICENGVARFFNTQIPLPAKAIPLSDLRPKDAVPRKMRLAKASEAKQRPSTEKSEPPLSLSAILALANSHTEEDLAKKGLSEPVRAAQNQRDQLLKEAAALLSPLGISVEQLKQLLD